MTVSELIEKLKDVPSNATVVVPGHDHAYRDTVTVGVTTGLYNREDGWTEDHGESVTPEAIYGKRKPIVLIGG